MPLQSSGPISLGDIRAELGTSSNDFSLNGAEFGTYGAINQNSTFKPNGLNPNTISEWYGYDHGGGGSPSDWGECYSLNGSGRGGGTFRYWICDQFGGCGITQSIEVPSFQIIDVCSSQTPILLFGSGGVTYSYNDCCNTTTTTTTTSTTTVTYTAVQLYYSASNSCPTTNLSTKYVNGTSFSNPSTTKIYNNTSGTLAPAGYYRDSGVGRYWNGTNLDFPTLC